MLQIFRKSEAKETGVEGEDVRWSSQKDHNSVKNEEIDEKGGVPAVVRRGSVRPQPRKF